MARSKLPDVVWLLIYASLVTFAASDASIASNGVVGSSIPAVNAREVSTSSGRNDAVPVQQISDGQVQNIPSTSTPVPVQQISDGQVQNIAATTASNGSSCRMRTTATSSTVTEVVGEFTETTRDEWVTETIEETAMGKREATSTELPYCNELQPTSSSLSTSTFTPLSTLTITTGTVYVGLSTTTTTIYPPFPTSDSSNSEQSSSLSSSTPTSAPQSITLSNCIITPTPTQQGMATNCNKFYSVPKGEGCDKIAPYFGIAESDIVKWNTVAGEGCTMLAADQYACVGTTTCLTTPAPIQTNMATNCDQFYKVPKGEDCRHIASKYSIAFADVVSWNPDAKPDCTNLYADHWACVHTTSCVWRCSGVGGAPTPAPAASQPTQAPVEAPVLQTTTTVETLTLVSSTVTKVTVRTRTLTKTVSTSKVTSPSSAGAASPVPSTAPAPSPSISSSSPPVQVPPSSSVTQASSASQPAATSQVSTLSSDAQSTAVVVSASGSVITSMASHASPATSTAPIVEWTQSSASLASTTTIAASAPLPPSSVMSQSSSVSATSVSPSVSDSHSSTVSSASTSAVASASAQSSSISTSPASAVMSMSSLAQSLPISSTGGAAPTPIIIGGSVGTTASAPSAVSSVVQSSPNLAPGSVASSTLTAPTPTLGMSTSNSPSSGNPLPSTKPSAASASSPGQTLSPESGTSTISISLPSLPTSSSAEPFSLSLPIATGDSLSLPAPPSSAGSFSVQLPSSSSISLGLPTLSATDNTISLPSPSNPSGTFNPPGLSSSDNSLSLSFPSLSTSHGPISLPTLSSSDGTFNLPSLSGSDGSLSLPSLATSGATLSFPSVPATSGGIPTPSSAASPLAAPVPTIAQTWPAFTAPPGNHLTIFRTTTADAPFTSTISESLWPIDTVLFGVVPASASRFTLVTTTIAESPFISFVSGTVLPIDTIIVGEPAPGLTIPRATITSTVVASLPCLQTTLNPILPLDMIFSCITLPPLPTRATLTTTVLGDAVSTTTITDKFPYDLVVVTLPALTWPPHATWTITTITDHTFTSTSTNKAFPVDFVIIGTTVLPPFGGFPLPGEPEPEEDNRKDKPCVPCPPGLFQLACKLGAKIAGFPVCSIDIHFPFPTVDLHWGIHWPPVLVIPDPFHKPGAGKTGPPGDTGPPGTNNGGGSGGGGGGHGGDPPPPGGNDPTHPPTGGENGSPQQTPTTTPSYTPCTDRTAAITSVGCWVSQKSTSCSEYGFQTITGCYAFNTVITQYCTVATVTDQIVYCANGTNPCVTTSTISAITLSACGAEPETLTSYPSGSSSSSCSATTAIISKSSCYTDATVTSCAPAGTSITIGCSAQPTVTTEFCSPTTATATTHSCILNSNTTSCSPIGSAITVGCSARPTDTTKWCSPSTVTQATVFCEGTSGTCTSTSTIASTVMSGCNVTAFTTTTYAPACPAQITASPDDDQGQAGDDLWLPPLAGQGDPLICQKPADAIQINRNKMNLDYIYLQFCQRPPPRIVIDEGDGERTVWQMQWTIDNSTTPPVVLELLAATDPPPADTKAVPNLNATLCSNAFDHLVDSCHDNALPQDVTVGGCWHDNQFTHMGYCIHLYNYISGEQPPAPPVAGPNNAPESIVGTKTTHSSVINLTPKPTVAGGSSTSKPPTATHPPWLFDLDVRVYAFQYCRIWYTAGGEMIWSDAEKKCVQEWTIQANDNPKYLNECPYLVDYHFKSFREGREAGDNEYPKPANHDGKCDDKTGHWDDVPKKETLRLPTDCSAMNTIKDISGRVHECVLLSYKKDPKVKGSNASPEDGVFLQCKDGMLCCEPDVGKKLDCKKQAPKRPKEYDAGHDTTVWEYTPRFHCSSYQCYQPI